MNIEPHPIRPISNSQTMQRVLVGMRLLWLVVMVAGLAAFIIALPAILQPFIKPPLVVQQTLSRLGISVAIYTATNLAAGLLFVLGFVTVAGMIYIRKPDNWMALFVAFFLVAFGLTAPLMGLNQPILQPFLAGFVTLLNSFAWFAANALFYLFPNWRFTPRWTWIPLAVLAVLVIFLSLPAGSPLSANNLPGPVLSVLMTTGWGIAIYAQVYRYRKVSTPLQRQQIKWVVYGLTTSMVLGLIIGMPGMIRPDLNGPTSLYGLIATGPVSGLVELLIPLSIGVAVLRYRLWDIDPLINRTLVYGLLTALIVGLYVATVSGLGYVFEEDGKGWAALLATALVAVLFQPLRETLQRWANHLIYGDRDDPYTVLARLGQRLETALAPEAVLPGIVETVAHSLKLPYVAVNQKASDNSLQTAAVYPSSASAPGEEAMHLPLVYQQEIIGELVLAPRAPGESFTSQDRRLLADLAHSIGAAAYNVRLTDDLRRLTADLQQSREHLVLTREEERRRIRRDLHDGLGPTLAALALSASSVADLAATNPQVAAKLAMEMQQEIRASIADIRRLVYELRPPALDELGLLAAIRDQANQLTHPTDGTSSGGVLPRDAAPVIQVEAPDQLAPLPAAVEVAVYRIVLEALTNVVRHASARCCIIRLDQSDGQLVIEISDDGIGLPSDHPTGVGLLSMRERAAELGGTCQVTALPGGGTQVKAILPTGLTDERGLYG